MTKTKHFDLIIIGTGSGNSIPNELFDDHSIAIVEKGAFGGTCLNVGCIPTKMYVYAAEVATTIQESEKYCIQGSFEGVDWPALVERVFHKRIDPIAQGGEEYRRGDKTPNIEVFDQPARFVGPRTIQTGQGDEEALIEGTQIVIAAGARPNIPPVIADSGIRYYTNEDIMRMPQLPKSMTVLGGGFIAVEFAHVFSSLGVDVTLVNRSEKLLRKMDSSISEAVTVAMKEKLSTKLGVGLRAARQDEDGVTLELEDGSTVTSEVVLVATGRTPNADLLDLDAAGIAMEKGSVKVDEFGRTSAEGVWALGDVSSPYQLKHVANAEMRAVQHNLLHPEDLRPMPHKHVPAAVFTDPQVATVGLSEEEAREQGLDITIKVQKYGDVAYGWAMEDTTSFAKLIADKKTRKLLGAHIVGPQASTLIQQLITVMAFDLDLVEVARNEYWIHPALPELIENALLGLEFEE